jgi:hypothetical protein
MSFVRDPRFALHSLARTPGLGCAGILTLVGGPHNAVSVVWGI